jgi:hypothetical protein
MTFKQELIDAYWDMVNTDPDLSTLSKKATLSRTTRQDGWDENGEQYAPQTQSVQIKAIFDNYSVEQLTLGVAAVGDVMCLLPAKKLRMLPLENDMVREGGVDYEVVSVTTDAAKAGFTLQLRRTVI